MEDKLELQKLTEDISALLTKKQTIKDNLENKRYSLKQASLKFHKKLLAVDFYKNYIFYPNGKPLNTMFNLGSMLGSWLPECDHGEGDYIKIVFKPDGDKLNLLYKTSYHDGDDCSLIRIPFELFESDKVEELKQFLSDFHFQAKEKHDSIVKEKKLQEINRLKKQIEQLDK